MLNIDEANQLLREHIKDQKNLYHSRETEVIMRALAKHFNEDEEKWGITGLLHDLDWEATEATPEQHGIKSTELIGDKLPEDAIHAIQSHNQGYTGIKRESNFDICLAAGESITGIISAYALVRPDKKIAGTKVKSITKKLKDKSFAAKVDREAINDIEKTGLQRADFLALAIEAVVAIADEVEM